MSLFSKRCIACVMPSQKKRLCLLFTSVAVGVATNSSALGTERGKEIRETLSVSDAAQPDVKEIRKISVSDIVVVRRIGR